MKITRSVAVFSTMLGMSTNADSPLSISFSFPRSPDPVLREYKALPGHNIHLVSTESGNFFIRGGAPTKATLDSLFEQSKDGERKLLIIDLRSPPRSYDLNPENGRLIPKDLKDEVTKRGGYYLSISSFEKDLPSTIKKNLEQGDVFIGCHYGFNRTGYVIGRLSEAGFEISDRVGLGSKDFESGAAYQRSLNADE